MRNFIKDVALLKDMIVKAFRMSKIFLLVWGISCILALFPLVNTYLFSRIIDGFVPDNTFINLAFIIILFFLYKIFASFLHSYSNFAGQLLRQKYNLQLKEDIIKSLDGVSPDTFEDNDWYNNKLHRVVRISGCLSDEILAIGNLLSMILLLISYLVYSASFSYIPVVAAIMAIVLTVLKSILFQKRRYDQSVRDSRLSIHYNRLYNDFFQIYSSLEIRTFRAFPFVKKEWKKRLDDVYDYRIKVKIKNAAVDFVFYALNFVIYFWILYELLFNIRTSPGVAISMIPFTLAILGQIESLSMV